MSKIRVRVTADHIAKGKPTQKECCPIALAFKDAGYETALVDTQAAFIAKGKDKDVIVLPEKARLFVERFDVKKSVEPFEFTVEV